MIEAFLLIFYCAFSWLFIMGVIENHLAGKNWKSKEYAAFIFAPLGFPVVLGYWTNSIHRVVKHVNRKIKSKKGKK